MVESIYDRINDYGSVKISLASPNDIRSWSFGEVRKPETINYRTYRPEKDGLFCERIFGPERDWECACGKYKGTKFKGIICDRCGVKVTRSVVRRKRMGHISLAAPVVHIWFFKAMPSRLANLLAMKTSDLEKVIYFQDYAVTDAGDTPLKIKELLSEEEYRRALEKYGDTFKAEMGAAAVRSLLQALDMPEAADRREAAVSLCAIGEKARATGEKLKELTNDPDDTVRVAAARAVLATIGDTEFVSDVLMEVLLDSESSAARTDAALGLGMIGYSPPDGVIRSLIYALEKDHHEWVRWQAARSIALYRAQAAEAESALSNALKNDSSQYVREAASYALEELKKEPEKRTFFGPQFMGEGVEAPDVGFSTVVIVVGGAEPASGTDDDDDDEDEDEEGGGDE